MLDRVKCPSWFFLHCLYRNRLSLDVWSEGDLSRHSYGREELCRCGAVPAKTLTYILGAKAAFPFRRRAAPGSRAGVITGPAGLAPGWSCLSGGGEADSQRCAAAGQGESRAPAERGGSGVQRPRSVGAREAADLSPQPCPKAGLCPSAFV